MDGEMGHKMRKCTFSRVVMARVEIERLGSVMRVSISRLHVETIAVWFTATLFSVRMAAKRRVCLGELRKSWNTEGT